MIEREAIESMIPHKGAMCLWDEVVDWNEECIRLRADNHRNPVHPLRSNGQLRAVHLCEYGAQAMAVHGGLRARASGGTAAPGVLVALRAVQLHVARVDELPDALECEADVVMEAEGSQQYAFRITHADRLIAEGRAVVMLQA
ncbi:MAG: phosphotransferase [Pseudomonadota bacterium]|nr:phosphotransferase [Pseudomonadota bacterium]